MAHSNNIAKLLVFEVHLFNGVVHDVTGNRYGGRLNRK